MKRWTDKEIGHLNYLLETNRTNTVYELARTAKLTLKNRSVTAIGHKLREIISNKEFDSDSVIYKGITYSAKNISGYICIKLADGTYKKFHYFVWEQEHGKEVPKGYHVHHIDGNRLNNRPTNLMLLDAREHIQLHQKGKPAETAMLFWFLEERNLWDEYIKYRENVIKDFPKE